MEEPRIPGLMDTPAAQYALTSDGVRIAYSVAGSGPLLLWVNNPPLTHAEAIWGIYNPYREALVKTNTVAMVDLRGFGLSDRDVGLFTVEGFGYDIEAVADKLAAAKFDLLTMGAATKPALAYAANSADRIRLLILGNPPAMGPASSDILTPLLRDIFLSDWETFSETFAGMQFGWNDARREAIARLVRSSATQQGLRHFAAFVASLDLRPHLASIRCPCLVMHLVTHNDSAELAEDARGLAAALPNATFRSVSNPPREVASPSQEAGTLPAVAGAGFRTILFTDIVEHTAMMERLGDAEGRRVLREHERITREALKAHGGTEIKTDGDSFMASFPSAQRAVECAIALQRALDARNGSAAEPIAVRIGVNAGEPIADQDDLFGASVILAARTKEQAGPGEIFVTEVVRRLVAGKNFRFIDRGQFAMKGIEDPARLYEVVWRE